MATIEYWIQLENHYWDICPGGKDRMTGLKIEEFQGGKPLVTVSLHSPQTGHTRTNVKMFQPVRDSDGDLAESLIFRRYTQNWAAPDDRKVNPWDINELDPTDNGTMGTIPGPVIECSVGDTVIVHFRNMDMRRRSIFKLVQATTQKGMQMQMAASGTFAETTPMGTIQTQTAEPQRALTGVQAQLFSGLKDLGIIDFPIFLPLPVLQRTHSMHTHGFVFAPQFDGAYPLTPPDNAQPVGAEAALWASVGVTGPFKQGDRVPPGGTFTYTWQTVGWPTTQGVWLYHDHSVCDTENVGLGAIGIVVIHPPAGDPVLDQDVDIRKPDGTLDPQFLPNGSPNGNPIDFHCFPFPGDFKVGVLPHFFENLGAQMASMPGMKMAGEEMDAEGSKGAKSKPTKDSTEPGMTRLTAEQRILHFGDAAFQLNDKLSQVVGFCTSHFRKPPNKALYLQLYHEFANVGMCVNGRKYLGNTPTVIGGPTTTMKFGVVGMGSMAHTFHIHGHRWLIPGPSGTGSNPLQFGGPMDTGVSQFEDTRVFGPANSFFFTINEGSSFMRALPPIGEWHMHCHVLAHMMDGMMGSLLIVNGGELAPPFAPLPVGKPCPTMVMNPPPDGGGDGAKTHTVTIKFPNFSAPSSPPVKVGDTVKFVNQDGFEHTVVWDSLNSPPNSPANALVGGASWTTPAITTAGTFNYHCGIHTEMLGTLTVSA